MYLNVKAGGLEIEIGQYYAYRYRGKFCIGQAIENPTKRPAYDWAMKNCWNGKIEYPYNLDVFVPNSECPELRAKIVEKE